jgi:DNA-binding CsgD family transcriptional regulator
VDFPPETPHLPPFPGDSYRYVVNCREGRLERVDLAVEAVLGYRPAEFDLPLLLSLADPDDLHWLPFKEQALMSFFSTQADIVSARDYTATYLIRLKSRSGAIRKILHQAVGVGWDASGWPQYLAVCHTDVGFLQPAIDHRVLFFGRPGAPAYCSLPVAPDQVYPLSESHPHFSPREVEILRYLSAGMSSKQIGERLNISKNTVDTYRRSMLRKAGSRNTAEMVRSFG